VTHVSVPATGPGPGVGEPRLQVFSALPEPLVAAVWSLVDAATEADGAKPLSEHVWLHVRLGGEGPDRHLVLLDPTGDEVVGYGHLDPTDVVAGSAAELVVHPAHRDQGYGRRLVEAAIEAAPDDRLRLWAHGDHPAARALAAGLGFREGRRLEQWRRSLSSPLPDVGLPHGVTLRAFRPGADEDAWLAVNARAFAGHPEQGTWTRRDLQARMDEDWFDPAGFLLSEEAGQIIGFHWTKIHGSLRHDHEHHHGHGHQHDPSHTRPPGRHHEGRADDDGTEHHHDHTHEHAHDPIGEVYVVGVDPSAQGRGLGKALTVAGLLWLHSRGLPQAMLYVESDNAPARATYAGLGFTHWDTDVMFYRGR
jgi:mycothiol synthase